MPDYVPYMLMWLLFAAVALFCLWLRHRRYHAAARVVALLPPVTAVGLFVTLLRDFRLPHEDGIPITAVMRWFMLDDMYDAAHHATALTTSLTLLTATVLFAAGLLLYSSHKSKPPAKPVAWESPRRA